MNILSIIEKKSNNQELTKEEIYFWVNGYTKQEIPDYQIAALLMAIKINGMTDDETYYLTKSYVDSGSTIEFDDIFVVDKHSTGGIGDKTSIILAPLMASLGINVGKLSGRGLGFTGGTIDKLESIKGFSTSLTQEEFVRNVTEKGISIIGQIDTLAPADKYIYALRDSTVTSNSLPLICASILSKKFAVSADLIMIDIKCGTGAFMKDLKSAERLAKLMIRIANKFDRKLSCIITDMSAPLGQQIGNGNEIKESIETLQGKGPKDITDISVYLASYALSYKEKISMEKAEAKVRENLNNNKAFDKFVEWVSLQKGETKNLLENNIFKPKNQFDILADKDGYLSIDSASEIGEITVTLGGGRVKKSDKINHNVGIKLNKKHADKVLKGDSLITVYYDKEVNKEEITKHFFDKAVSISSKKIKSTPLILKVVD